MVNEVTRLVWGMCGACGGRVWGVCDVWGACLVCGGVVWVVGRRVLERSWGESIARRFIIRIPW